MRITDTKHKKTRIFFAFFFFVVCFCLAACSKQELAPLPVDENISQLLETMGYRECSILSIADYNSFVAYYDVTEEEVESRVQELFQQNPVEVKSEKLTLENGDLAKISYCILDQGKIIFESPNQVVKIGTVNFDYNIESSLLGLQVGETYSFEYVNAELSDNSMVCNITPLYIYTLSAFSPDKESLEASFGVNSLEELYSVVYEEIENEKKEETWSQIQARLISESQFQISEETLIEATSSAVLQEKLYSTVLGGEFDTYLEETYGMSKTQFYDFCYQNSENDIKHYLLLGAIAYCEDIQMDASSIESYCASYGIDPNSISEEELCYIHYYYLQDCVISKLCKLQNGR